MLTRSKRGWSMVITPTSVESVGAWLGPRLGAQRIAGDPRQRVSTMRQPPMVIGPTPPSQVMRMQRMTAAGGPDDGS